MLQSGTNYSNFPTSKTTTVPYQREIVQPSLPPPSSHLCPQPAMRPAHCSMHKDLSPSNNSQINPKPALLFPTAQHQPDMKTGQLPRCPDRRNNLQLIQQLRLSSSLMFYQQWCGQQDKDRDCPPGLGTGDTTPQILGSVLVPSLQEGH